MRMRAAFAAALLLFVARPPAACAEGVEISGDLRVKYEHYRNKTWNPQAGSDAEALHRLLVRIDAHPSRLHALVDVETANAVGGRNEDPTWRNALATPSAWLGYRFGGSTSVDVRAGRQRLAYGSGRMIDDRAGTNTIAPFDGVLAHVVTGAWQTDAFAMRPVAVARGAFDDRTDPTRTFAGIYASRRRGASTLDLYVVTDDRRTQPEVPGTASEARTSAGARLSGSGPRLDGDVEAIVQRGSLGGRPVRAYAIDGEGGYTWAVRRHRWRAGIGIGIDSGDRGDGALRTFRAPYPTGITFGIVQANGNGNTSGGALGATYGNGPFALTLKAYAFTRTSVRDGVFSPAGIPLRGAGRGGAARIGDLAYVSATDRLRRGTTLTIAYARYLTGAFLDANGPRPGVASANTSYFTAGIDRPF